MRILYIHQYFCTREGRSGTRSYEFARHLVRHGHHVTMLTSTSDLSDVQVDRGRLVTRLDVEGIRVVAVRVPYSQLLGTMARIASFLRFMVLSSWLACRESRHDVVIATSTPLTVGIPGMLVSRFRRIPLVFEVRDLWPEAPIQMGIIRNKAAWKVLRALERAIYRSSSRIIALSPGMRDGVVAAGTPPENVTVIPNCSDLDLFEPGAPDTSLVEKFALQDRFVAVYAGAMGEANAVDIVLDAATALQSKSEAPITFLMVGAGKKAEELQKRARDLGLRNMVFVGSVSRREVPAFLRLGSVCLVLFKNVPVLGTNSPNKMFDAFASGRPVIVNNDGWTRELVRQHGVGLTAEPGSAESLVDQLLRLAGNRRETLEMGHRARRLAEEAFDRRRLAVQFESVLRQTVEGNQGETGRAQGEQAMDHEHISQAAAAMAEAPNGVEDAPQPPLDHVHAME